MKLELAKNIIFKVHGGHLEDLYTRAYMIIADSGLIAPKERNLRSEGNFSLIAVINKDPKAIEGKIKPSELIALLHYLDDDGVNATVYEWLIHDGKDPFITTAELAEKISQNKAKSMRKKIQYKKMMRKLQPENPGVALSSTCQSPEVGFAAKKHIWGMLTKMQLTGEISSWDCNLWPLDETGMHYGVDFQGARWYAKRGEVLDLMRRIESAP